MAEVIADEDIPPPPAQLVRDCCIRHAVDATEGWRAARLLRDTLERIAKHRCGKSTPEEVAKRGLEDEAVLRVSTHWAERIIPERLTGK